MADARGEITTTATITLVISESEARALHALAGYGTEKFLEVFYEKLGKCYLLPHASGLQTLFGAARGPVGTILARLDERRKPKAGV